MDDLMTKLLNFAFKKGISVTVANVLNPYTPCASRPSKHAIVINSNWHNPQEICLQTAHEIGHVLNEDAGVLYYCSTASHNSIEFKASQTGIDILVSLYFSNTIQEEANLDTFVNQLSIPSYLVPYAEGKIREYYLNK